MAEIASSGPRETAGSFSRPFSFSLPMTKEKPINPKNHSAVATRATVTDDSQSNTAKCTEITVAVGTTIADRPPRRSVQARLRIRLLPWMAGGEACIRVRVQSAGLGNPPVLLSCRALSSPTTCRFIPALSGLPDVKRLVASIKRRHKGLDILSMTCGAATRSRNWARHSGRSTSIRACGC
jgi:hypothetical protein